MSTLKRSAHFSAKKAHIAVSGKNENQGDQVGQIFAHWAIDNFWKFF
jgi:hypothetical protein